MERVKMSQEERINGMKFEQEEIARHKPKDCFSDTKLPFLVQSSFSSRSMAHKTIRADDPEADQTSVEKSGSEQGYVPTVILRNLTK